MNTFTLESYKSPGRPVTIDLEKDKMMKRKISDAATAIRKKYRALKMGKVEVDENIFRILRPVIDPIKDLKESTEQAPPIKKQRGSELIKQIKPKTQNEASEIKPTVSNAAVNTETLEIKPTVADAGVNTEPQKESVKFLPTSLVGELDGVKDDDDDDDEEYYEDPTIEDVIEMADRSGALEDFFSQFPPIARYYVEGMFTKHDGYDENYGVRYDFETNKFYIGNQELIIGNRDELIIGDKKYEGSQGLYELLFMKNPAGYNDADLRDYKDILKDTNAHKRNYAPDGQVKGNRYYKYTGIIKPLLEGGRKIATGRPVKLNNQGGSGLPNSMVYNDKPIEYIYWNEINELVDRLRLLMASKDAGNTTAHDNEILAIINELKEAGVIS